MTPEQLDEARAKETLRKLVDSGKVYCHEDIAALGARLAREGWTPPEPEPEPVDPDVLAFREWAAERWPVSRSGIEKGGADYRIEAKAFLAGARMAREQERERAKVLVEYVEIDTRRLDGVGGRYALAVLAKYRGEA